MDNLQAGFRDIKDFNKQVTIPYWEIVSGRPAGEVYHRAVYVAFSLEAAEDCRDHILDEYEEWQLNTWLWGPHINKHDGNPAAVTVWNGFREEPAPRWQTMDELHEEARQLMSRGLAAP